MKLSPRQLWIFGAIALCLAALIALLVAPSNQIRSGSTYSRDPSGYGAWYAFMEERGTPVMRWQKPLPELFDQPDSASGSTLLRVYSGVEQTGNPTALETWVEKGNRLIILGDRRSATNAPFRTQQPSPAGLVEIETGRRAQTSPKERKLLGDRFGAIVWSRAAGDGQIVYATTPYLAANAYQDSEGNYEFLARLVARETLEESALRQNSSSSPRQIWVDEYIHGYKDTELIAEETQESVLAYWSRTPLLPIALQGALLILIAIWAGNHRFGGAIALPAPTANNSQAYIEALAGVLQKAESREFVLEILGKAERHQLQQTLGLGTNLLEPDALIEAWP